MDDAILAVEYVLLGVNVFNIAVALIVAVRFALYTYYAERPGLMPWHVWLIALSYAAGSVLTVTRRAQVETLDDPLWRWVLYGIFVLTGFAALIIVARHQWRLPARKDR